ncbi:hypothetical protein J8J04_02070 ['Fragaria x ananassa' phyllody phytoplasma]|uniref:Uncharacterized protein n=1 Tax='Fragaria x ananassa' phyllody phytoplasma TaxID=2358428 RepID=A0ABS5K3I3_9MOLU|nr:hypothetical protein ['Fragaria x ananassa' phyllody phytoplasma]MBS2126469.1 hypothetical protein ['Fragaria x ananassa' phyllody phytoplasma]
MIIIVLGIIFIIGFFEGINEAKQEQKSLSNHHEELEDNKENQTNHQEQNATHKYQNLKSK